MSSSIHYCNDDVSLPRLTDWNLLSTSGICDNKSDSLVSGVTSGILNTVFFSQLDKLRLLLNFF